MIKLSASSIKDWLVCPQRYFWRTAHPELVVPTPAMYAGTIVHELLEKEWANPKIEEVAKEKVKSEERIVSEKVLTSIHNYQKYLHMFSLKNDDLIEHHFNITLKKGVVLTGVIDRITTNGILIDWKTNKINTYKLDTDVQFLIYNFAYKHLFKRNPTQVVMLNLYLDKITRLGIDAKRNEEILFDNIIPSIIRQIKAKNFPYNGVFSDSCRWCAYKDACMPELKSNSKFLPVSEDYEY